MRVLRYDVSPNPAKIERLPNGGIRMQAALARTGCQTYTKADGTPYVEYRPAAEVFSKPSLDTFNGTVVTIGHQTMVDPNTYRELSVGHVSSAANREGDKVVATVDVLRQDAIDAIMGGNLKEVSAGYTVDLEWKAGTAPDGTRYDAVQHNIIMNHIALLPLNSGRAGPEVKLRLDSAGHQSILPLINMAESSDKVSVHADEVVVRVDGQAEIDTLKGKVAALEAKLAEATDSKRLDGLVSARVTLVREASEVLGADWRADGLSDGAIRSAVVAKALPAVKLDGASEDFVRGLYAAALAKPNEVASPIYGARAALVSAMPKEDALDEIEAARLEGHKNDVARHASNRKVM